MKRLVSLLGLAAVAVVLVTGLFFAPIIAVPVESEELASPTLDPAVITPSVPTFVTVTAAPGSATVKRVKLQYYDAEKGKWRTVGKLKDDGKAEDEVAADGMFTLRIRLLDLNGSTEVSLPKRNRLKSKGVVPSPAQLRLAATKRGQTGLVVSPSFWVAAAPPMPVSIADAAGGPPVSVSVPETVDTVDADNPGTLLLLKAGSDGYDIEVTLEPNPSGFPLAEWIRENTFEGIDLSEYFVPVAVRGLQGFQYQGVQEGGPYVYVWLDDPANTRVVVFAIQPRGGIATDNFADNFAEILTIVNSLQP